jgi:2-amino-4-hydroxy-6-hydroxymethyldihydropteridine diphosphokinase
VLLSLGSNLGDREAALEQAVAALDAEAGVRVCMRSQMYETAPVGGVEQPPFLNMALGVETTLAPLALLARVKALEVRLGRVPSEHWGPRAIDIDLILWGDLQYADRVLTLPHPEFRKRAFVLRPLADIAPDALDPVTGRDIKTLAADVVGDVRLFTP